MNPIKFLLILLIFTSSSVWAAAIAYTNRGNVPVKASATVNSSTVVALKKGQKLAVYSKKGNWYRIGVALPGGFKVQGWVPKTVLSKTRPASSRTRSTTVRRAPVRRAPVPTRTAPRRRTSTDDFFRPSPAVSRRAPTRRSTPSQSNSPLGGKLKAQLGGSLMYFTHSVDSTNQSFSYSLTGPALTADLSYQVWQLPAQELSVILGVKYTYAMLNVETNLQDSSSSTFSTRNQKNVITDLVIKASVEKKLSSMTAGLNLGYQIFDFKGDDIESSSGVPLGLYTPYSTKSILAGPYLRFPMQTLTLYVGVDVLLIPKFEEKSVTLSGDDAKPKTGFIPKASAIWNLKGPGALEFGYELRFHQIAHSSTAERAKQALANTDLTNMVHNLQIAYQYRF